MVTIIPPGVLRELRGINEANLPDLAEVYRRAKVVADGGEIEDGAETSLFFTPCRLSPFGATPREGVIAGALEHPDRLWRVTLSAGTLVPDDTRIRVTAADGSWAKDMNVVSTLGLHTTTSQSIVIAEED